MKKNFPSSFFFFEKYKIIILNSRLTNETKESSTSTTSLPVDIFNNSKIESPLGKNVIKSKKFHNLELVNVRSDINDLEEEIDRLIYKVLSIQESVRWLEGEKVMF